MILNHRKKKVILVYNKSLVWNRLVNSDSYTLLLRALKLVPPNCNRSKLQDLVKKICLKKPTRQKIIIDKTVGRVIDWPLFCQLWNQFDTFTFPSNILICLLKTAQCTLQLNTLVPYLKTQNRLIIHCPLLYNTKTCRRALLILQNVPEMINIWLEGLIMRTKGSAPTLPFLKIINEYTSTIDFLSVFVNSSWQNNCIPSLWFFEYLSYFKLTRAENIRFLLQCLVNLKADSLKRLIPKLDIETQILLGHYCLYSPKKFKECIWPTLSQQCNIEHTLIAEQVYFLSTTPASSSLALQWQNNSCALESFEPAEIRHILSCIHSHLELPIKFLKANPQYIAHVCISNDTPHDILLELGLENLSTYQLQHVNWAEFMSLGKDVPANVLRCGGSLNSDLELLCAASETVPVEIDEDDTCRICLHELEIGQELIQLMCNHIFHSGCFIKSLNTCPLCRQQAY